MAFEHDDYIESGVNIKVVGVGGGGNNAVDRMIDTEIRGVEFISVNTDGQALRKSRAQNQITIGQKITKGHGAGADPDVGKRAAEENMEDIKNVLEGADMVFIAAGMGGGTGTGAAPVVAKIAHEMGILTVAIVTKPFLFEGSRRMRQAEAGIVELSNYVDSLVIIPNERLKQVSEQRISLANAFQVADDVLRLGVQSISELINVPGFINLDFADVTSVMQNAGYAHMGVGSGTGPQKAEIAAKAAISSPLLETSIKGATGILVSITMSPDVALEDATLASQMITDEASADANVIWGVAFDPNIDDELRITIIATGFEKSGEEAIPSAPVQPSVQSKQVPPVTPVVTARNVAPTQPAAPVHPVRPAQPAAKPVQPVQPAQPVRQPAPVRTEPVQPAPEKAEVPEAPKTPVAPETGDENGDDKFEDILSVLRRRRADTNRGSRR